MKADMDSSHLAAPGSTRTSGDAAPNAPSAAVSDEPLMQHPVVRALEQRAIAMYRADYPNGVLWQELADSTRLMWVTYAEQKARG